TNDRSFIDRTFQRHVNKVPTVKHSYRHDTLRKAVLDGLLGTQSREPDGRALIESAPPQMNMRIDQAWQNCVLRQVQHLRTGWNWQVRADSRDLAIGNNHVCIFDCWLLCICYERSAPHV